MLNRAAHLRRGDNLHTESETPAFVARALIDHSSFHHVSVDVTTYIQCTVQYKYVHTEYIGM